MVLCVLCSCAACWRGARVVLDSQDTRLSSRTFLSISFGSRAKVASTPDLG